MPYDPPAIPFVGRAIASVEHAVNYNGVRSELPARNNTSFRFTTKDSALNQRKGYALYQLGWRAEYTNTY